MQEGYIVRGYSGFYYVHVNGKIYECSLRGRYKIKKQDFLPGDKVVISIIGEDKGVIEEVLPRKVELVRPYIANISKIIIVAAIFNPKPDLVLIDRLLVMAAKLKVSVTVVFNKVDLVNIEEQKKYMDYYKNIGYQVIMASTKNNQGIEDIKNILKDNISVFAGLSGVGKSSILNKILPNEELKIGDISHKNKKGKHTTRYVSLLPLPNGGLVADTPGFSRLYLPEMKREELTLCFPDFKEFNNFCRFSSCLHKSEPDCAVKKAVEDGEISKIRYEHYIQFLDEVLQNERSY